MPKIITSHDVLEPLAVSALASRADGCCTLCMHPQAVPRECPKESLAGCHVEVAQQQKVAAWTHRRLALARADSHPQGYNNKELDVMGHRQPEAISCLAPEGGNYALLASIGAKTSQKVIVMQISGFETAKVLLCH